MTLRAKILVITYVVIAFFVGVIIFAVTEFTSLDFTQWQELHDVAGFDLTNFGFVLAAIIILLGLAVVILIDKFIVARIRYVRENVSRIGTSGDFTGRIQGQGKDEISGLITEINGMLLKLEWSHSELQERETQLRQITDNMMDMISQININGIIKFVSPSFKNILGYNEKDLLEKPIFDFMHPADHREFVTVMKNAVQTASLGLIEFRLVHASGSYIAVESIGNLIFDKEGAIAGAIFGSRDITERKRAEEALKASEEKYKQIVVDIEEGYYEADLEGKLTFYNSSLCKITGFTKREMNKADSDIIFKEPKEISIYYDEVYKSGKPRRGLIWNLSKKDGSKVFVEGSIYLMKDKQENPIGFRGLVRDVTESKLAEQEIKRVNEELEHRVAERTAQLEAANKELESFSYSVSHDLRAPLRSIDGFSTALMVDYMDELDPQAKDYLQRVRSASQRMGHLIDDLLNLSRVMRSEMSRVDVNLSELAEEVFAELQEAEPERAVETVIQPDILVKGDPRLLKIMLVNLLGNAWKFTGKTEQARIELGLYQENSETVFFIRDNGAGFDMEYADKLFGPFQRLHSPGEFPGTGIGLATVARIIKRHNGSIWAESAVGEGASFYFLLEAQGLKEAAV